MTSWLQDLRYALRMQARHPWIAAVIVVILAVGIGVVTAMFNLVNAMLIRPLPYDQPEELATLRASRLQEGTDWYPVSAPNLADWEREGRSLDEVAAFARSRFDLSSRSEAPARIQGARTAHDLFPLLGIQPQLGRSFHPEDDLPGAAPVAILGDALWKRRFQADPGVVGRTVRLDGTPHRVVGVMPPGFEFPEWAELWVPLALDPAQEPRGQRWLDAYARLAPGTSVEQAQQELSRLASRLEAEHPEANEGWGVRIRPLRDELMPAEARIGTLLLLVAVGLVLLIVCANVATLFLAQTIRRQREYAIRFALGAERSRVLRQVLVESLFLAISGGALGVLVSKVTVRAMEEAIPVPIPFWIRFDLDHRVLLFTLGIAVLSGVLFGLAPALRAARSRRFDALQGTSRGSSGGRGARRIRNAMVIAELAVALVLLASAMLVVKSFYNMQAVDRGFLTERILTANVSLSGADFEEPGSRIGFLREMTRQVLRQPGVEAAGVVDYLPTSRRGFASARVRAEGADVPAGQEPGAARHAIGPQYLETVGIPLLEGRGLQQQEVEEAAPVALVSRSLAESLWQDGEAVGRRVRLAGDEEAPWLVVVGVVGDIQQAYTMGGLDAWPTRQIYLPLGLEPARTMTLAVRSSGPDPAALTEGVRAAVEAVHQEVPLYEVLAMDQVLKRLEWLPRFWGQMFSALSIIALLIAALGVYSVTSYMVSQRHREIGIRMALGARPRQILGLVVGQGMRLALFGVLLGVVLAFFATGAMSTLLYGVEARDTAIFSGVAVLLALIALVASLLPGRRAARTSPQTALRRE